MDNEIKELEEKIYDKFYKECPDGDARMNGLWKDVLDAKKTNDVDELEYILDNVHYYDY